MGSNGRRPPQRWRRRRPSLGLGLSLGCTTTRREREFLIDNLLIRIHIFNEITLGLRVWGWVSYGRRAPQRWPPHRRRRQRFGRVGLALVHVLGLRVYYTKKSGVVVESTLLTPRINRFTRALPPLGSSDPLRLAEGGALPYKGARHCPGFSFSDGPTDGEGSDDSGETDLLWCAFWGFGLRFQG